jgi:hypothetical protein
LENNILGDYSQFPSEILPDLPPASSEVFNRTAMELMLAYRFNFIREHNDVFFVEFGAYRTFRVNNRYSARFVGDNYIDIDLSTRADIFNRFDAGIQASFGMNGTSWFFRYRLTDPQRNFDASLPRLVIGIRITAF